MTIEYFQSLHDGEKKALLLPCCGSTAWVKKMLQVLPTVRYVDDILRLAEKEWYSCSEEDWKEAFTHHPKIGDLDSLKKKFATDQFAGNEQAGINEATEKVLEELAEGNQAYLQKFGYIFIVFATGKSANEMLEILRFRLLNQPHVEIKMAMEEQNKIMRVRLQKIFE